jgi:hypothetical protein
VLTRHAEATRKALEQQQETLRQERVLGIAGAGTGGVSAARESARLRAFLNDELKRLGLAQTGSSPLGPFVQELYRMGDINKRQYESLEKILKVIVDARDNTGKIASSVSGNISQRLAEIKQELGSLTGFTLAGAQHSLSAILERSGARLTGTAAQRARFLEQGQYALAHHGQVLTTNRAALGVPLTTAGAPSTLHVVVTVKGNTAIDRAGAQVIADAIAPHLRRKSGRNTVQMTGSNAGTNLGF